MNSQDLLRVMSLVDPALIEEAAPDRPPQKHRSPWLKWGAAAAACLLVVLCAIPVIRLTSGWLRDGAAEGDETLDMAQENVTPSDRMSYSFEDYQSLAAALQGSELLREAEANGYGKRYTAMLDGFRSGTLVLSVPHSGGEPCRLTGHAEWQKITLLTDETFNLPWIWYYCDFDGKPIVVSVSYTAVLDPSLTEGCTTFRELAQRLNPESAKRDSTVTVTFMGEPVEASVFARKDSRTYYRLLWNGMILSVWGYEADTVPDEAFWTSFSLEPIQ